MEAKSELSNHHTIPKKESHNNDLNPPSEGQNFFCCSLISTISEVPNNVNIEGGCIMTF